MKKTLLLFILLIAPLTQAAEILTIDMNKVFENYYRTIMENKKLAKQKEITENRLKEMETGVYKLQNEYQQLMRDSTNPALTDEARQRKKEQADAKATEGQAAVKNLQYFQKNLQEEARKLRKTTTAELTAEIQKVIVKYAQEKQASLILDESGQALNGMSVVLYNDGSNSITDAIISRINLGHEDIVKKALEEAQSAQKTGK